LDLTVQAGEVHGFLGPNGAGKTTTIRVLLGLLRTDAGHVVVLGGDPWRDAVALHRRLAYVPGEVSLWPKLSGGEVVDLFGRLRGDLDRRRRDELLGRFELDPTKKARTYSKGNRQKVGLVAAPASGAELLILDEPTSGLDPLIEVRVACEWSGHKRFSVFLDKYQGIVLGSQISAKRKLDGAWGAELSWIKQCPAFQLTLLRPVHASQPEFVPIAPKRVLHQLVATMRVGSRLHSLR
jgi:ABC-type transport system involved in cytochrome c biogenesis ATPase subunit